MQFCKFQQVDTSGKPYCPDHINGRNVRYVQASIPGKTGKTHIFMLGSNLSVSVVEDLPDVLKALPNLVSVTRFDSLGRGQFENEAFINPEVVQTIVASERAADIRFTDNTEIAVKRLPEFVTVAG